MTFQEFWIDRNPLDAIARRAFGMPKCFKEILATHINPRPAGLVLRSGGAPLKPWPWSELSDLEFGEEMQHNSGSFISVLLRAPEVTNQADFVAIFDEAEAEYRAALRRLLWPGSGAWMTERRVDLAIKRLQPSLQHIEQAFVAWGTKHRQLVVDTFEEMLTQEAWLYGNARKDLARANPAWLKNAE